MEREGKQSLTERTTLRSILVSYSRKILREKPFTNFVVLWLFTKVFFFFFFAKLGHGILLYAKSGQFAKVFSLESFQLYGIVCLSTKVLNNGKAYCLLFRMNVY